MLYGRRTKRKTEIVEVTYPAGTLEALSEVLDAKWAVPFGSVLAKARATLEAARIAQAEDATFLHYLDAEERRQRLAMTVAWEKANGRQVPRGFVVVLLDGQSSNMNASNLYCLPAHELASWLRFVRTPIDVHISRLEKSIMTLRTSDDVKNKLLTVLDQLVDPAKPPDILRQRAVCETVQALVGLLKVEVAYIRAIDGDGVVPFLEGSRKEAMKRREEAGRRSSNPMLSGPAASHPWRGLGGRGKD